MNYETRTLQALELMARRQISAALLPRARAYMDHEMQRLVVELRARIYEDPSQLRRETLRFVEQPVYRNWRQHLVASLPVDSFRRRFLERFWEIESPNGTRITHEVIVERRALFPEMREVYPEHFGPVQYVIQTDDIYRREPS
jgi:hypothetical protein